MKKILVIGMTSTPGGVESFLINYCLNKNMTGIQFDFLCPSENKIAYSEEIEKQGNVYYVVPKSKNMFLHKKQLKDFFKTYSKEYVAIWANLNSLMNVDFLKIARKSGIKHIIVHSHNSSNMGGLLQKILHTKNKYFIGKIATEFWACSSGAAKWFYPNKLPSTVINNAINVDKYEFDQLKRENIRKEYDLDGCKVIGHIGRLHFQKNQSQLLVIMYQLIQKDESYRLVLIGSGPDKEMLVREISQMGLEKYVIFAGEQKDIGGWLSAFDVFVFPSRFEGLSIVGLEAQANGIPIIASTNAINDEGLINSNVIRISLDNSVEEWCHAIEQSIGEVRCEHSIIKERFRAKCFDIDVEVGKMSKYFNALE